MELKWLNPWKEIRKWKQECVRLQVHIDEQERLNNSLLAKNAVLEAFIDRNTHG